MRYEKKRHGVEKNMIQIMYTERGKDDNMET
jgi:hypothetical protein